MERMLFKNFSRNFSVMIGVALLIRNDYFSQTIVIIAVIYSIFFYYYKYKK